MHGKPNRRSPKKLENSSKSLKPGSREILQKAGGSCKAGGFDNFLSKMAVLERNVSITYQYFSVVFLSLDLLLL